MGSSTLFVGLILLQISWTLEATLHYAVIFPSEFRSQHAERVCIHLEGAQGESRVQLSLNLGDKNTTLIDRHFQEDSAFTCIPLKAPHPSEGVDQVGTLTVSIENAKENIVKSSKVLVKKERTSILVQTDKAVYKPGQTVKFRILSLNEDLQPENRQFPVVDFQDPSKNRIGQWLNVSLNQGIADLSLPLSSEPQLGEYSIRVDKMVHTFSVEEYVLPKFEVTLRFPKHVMFNSEHFSVQLCGRYTYGKPVQGNYTAKVCRNPLYYGWRPVPTKESELCVHFSGKLDESGCHNLEAKSETLKMNDSKYEKALRATASILEEGTEIQLSTTSQTSISTVINKVSFVDADSSYKRGIPYKGRIKVLDAGDSPKGGVTVYLQSREGSINQTLLTNENGQVSFTLNTESWDTTVFLTASTNREPPRYVSNLYQADYGFAPLTLEPFYSRNKNFLKLYSLDRVLPCEGQQEVQAEYIIKHAELKETKHLELHYLVASEGSIQDSGSLEISTESGSEDLHGEVTLKLPLSAGISPKLHALVYIFLPNGEILADSATFNLLRCFKNKVSVGFSPDEVLPGSDVSLRVQAAPESLCGLRVVDQSVVLMKPEKELTEDKVYDLFPLRLSRGYDYRIDEPGHRCFRPPIFPPILPGPVFPDLSQRRTTRRIINPFYDEDDHDVYSLFKDMRLKIVTSDNIKKPRKCYENILMFAHPGLAGPAGSDRNVYRVLDSAPEVPVIENLAETVKDSEKEEQKVRTYFPETWLWELFPLGDSGSADLHHKAPDTITDWNAGAVCMGPGGFGLSPSSSLRVFQPFFVDLTLPYSVVRGESFTLKASVFSYLKQCIKVQITLQPTLELEQTPCADCQYSSCLCADQSKTFTWNLKASKLGEVNITVRTEAVETKDLCQNEIPIVPKQGSTDTVVKPLLVQPGGVLEEKAHSSLLCTKQGEEHSTKEEISLIVPENTLKDSERAHITVLGDLMGTAMQNLDRLLAMPYGCGEQNMVLFAPNIFILQYLEKSHQLNPEIQSKAIKFLESGYQRQLTYKRNDGSYSAFGNNDAEGNTWLTAFVAKSFNKAQPYIFIDKSHLNDSISWLKKHRQENGCFRSVGKLFNNALKGGVDDDISLSAYVTISLLEIGLPVEDPLVRDAVSCLRKAAADVSNIYTQALLLYTFTLSGETELRKTLMDKLDAKAVRGEGQLHWERESAPASDVPYWNRAPSAEVELAAYVLLALVSGSTKDVGKASQIVNWLSKQQNPYGGYSSTQDTVVAIQALAKYAEVTFSDKGDVTVTVSSKTGFLQQFHVNNNNRLLLQRASLPSIPGEYTVTSSGGGCVYVQTVLRYNVPPPKKDAAFSLTVKPFTRRDCLKDQVTKFEILINVSYTGSREKSNMAVIEVKMLSGWIPVKSTIKKLEKDKLIQRSDIQTDMVTLYLNEVGHTPVALSYMVEQEFMIKNLKPAPVKVYDYYETDDQAIVEYNHPCPEENAGNSR